MKLKDLARRVLVTACLIVIGTVLASALIVPNTEPYRSSVQFIETQARVRSHLGEIIGHHLPLIGGWSLKYGGGTDEAAFDITVAGARGRGVVHTELTKSAGAWKVIRATLILDKGLLIPLTGAEAEQQASNHPREPPGAAAT